MSPTRKSPRLVRACTAVALPLAVAALDASCATSNERPHFGSGDGGDGDGASVAALDGATTDDGAAPPPGDATTGGHDATTGDPDGGATGDDSGTTFITDSGHGDGPLGCASSTYAGKESPAALLFVLDRSGTMSDANKYSYAQLAIATAIDADAFDTMSIGLLGFPNVQLTSLPACLSPFAGLGGLDGLECGVSGVPQVAIQPAGTDKSNAPTGVRHEMYQWLVNNTPAHTPGDANPSYMALKNGITALQALSFTGQRLLVYVTDGGASCAADTGRPAYTDANNCQDWEQPDTIVSLLKTAHDAATNPVHSFVIGVPGADTTASDGDPSRPPYSVRLALSAYAYAGSPETAPTTCTGTAFTKAGSDPSLTCHFDMSTSYSVQTLVDAITQIRSKLLGCTYDIPTPEAGAVDPNKVNVNYAIGGAAGTDLAKRANSADTCVTDGCWDYDVNGKIQLIGKACTDVQANVDASVKIVVGCQTRIK